MFVLVFHCFLLPKLAMPDEQGGYSNKVTSLLRAFLFKEKGADRRIEVFLLPSVPMPDEQGGYSERCLGRRHLDRIGEIFETRLI